MIRAVIALALVLVLSAVAVGIYHAGGEATRAEYALRDNAALRKAIGERDIAVRQVQAIERERAADMVALEAEHEREVAREKVKLDRALARVRSGELRGPACASGSAEGPSTETRTGAGERAHGEKGRFSGEDAEFLIRFAGEADAVVLQLTACQAVVRNDRR